jgi:protein-S-isoprenylcysteine O-methyltransferase Ste14
VFLFLFFLFFLFHDLYLELGLHLFLFWVKNLVILVVFVSMTIEIQRPSITKKEETLLQNVGAIH